MEVFQIQADPRKIYAFGLQCYSVMRIVCMHESGQELTLSRPMWEESVEVGIRGWRFHADVVMYFMHSDCRVATHIGALEEAEVDSTELAWFCINPR